MLPMITNSSVSKAGNGSGSSLVENYKARLQAQDLSRGMLGKRIRTIQHLITWLSDSGIGLETLDIRVLHNFLNHDCACSSPHGYRKNLGAARWHLHLFLDFLIKAGRAQIPSEIEAGGRVIEAFLQTLAVQGYVDDSIAAYRKRCRHFIVWLYLEDIALSEIDDGVSRRFLSHNCSCVHPGFFIRAGRFIGSKNSSGKIKLFIAYLVRTGITPQRPIPELEQPGQYLEDFRIWLQRFRGIGEKTIQRHLKAIRVHLPYFGDDPEQYSATLVRNTLLYRFDTASREVLRQEATTLRLYLRFLALEGLCHPRLVGAVPAVPRQKHATLPRHLPQEDIERIIASCVQETPKGKRDHAMLLLLARLALRAGDVACLKLTDIDWENALIRVCGKSRRTAVLPLPQDVGDVLRDYILHARPNADTGSVFLRMIPPLDHPLSSAGVSAVARAAIKRSGVKADGLPPAHVFRHSAATNLLRGSAPLEVISALLRHQSVDTTAIYARVDIPMLREVAQPWPVAGEMT